MDTINEEMLPEENSGIVLNIYAISDLKKAAKWAKFLAIVGFVCSGLIAVSAFSIGTIMTTMSQLSPMGGVVGAVSGLMTVIYLIVAGVTFVINLFLYQFATRAIQAIEMSDNPLMGGAMHRLQSFFKAMGIIMIVYLSLMVLVFAFAILGAALMHH